jgi:tripartite-type tricarboxylate transporter receptor subunit TctC
MKVLTLLEGREIMRRFLFIIGFILSIYVFIMEAPALQAQPFPSHPIQLVIPGAPGDAVDIAARSVAEELSQILKISVVPINKPGGAATIGTDFAAKSKKDGYTLVYGLTSGFVYGPAFSPESVPYDPLRDLEPLGLHVYFPTVLSIQTEAPWKNFSEFIEYAQKNPGKVRCGTLGVGSINHFQLEVIKSLTGADITMVPFKGASPALTALLGGHIETAFVAVIISQPHYKSGKLRGILLDQKVTDLSDIPTLPQLGYKQDLPSSWFAFFAPTGIPDEAKKVLVPAIEKAIKNQDLMTKLQKMWYIPNYKSPAELKQILNEDFEKARAVVKRMGVTK